MICNLYACERSKAENSIIKGSDTEVNLVLELAESYMSKDPAFSLAITGGGSGLGIAALLNGKTQVANSFRPLSQAEWNLAREQDIHVHTFVWNRFHFAYWAGIFSSKAESIS